MIAIVSMILRGSVDGGSGNPYFKQAVLTLSQLLVYNSTKATRELSTSVFHSKKRELPIAIYLETLIHTETRKSGVGLYRNLVYLCSMLMKYAMKYAYIRRVRDSTFL